MRKVVYPIIVILVAVGVFLLVRPDPEPDVVLYCGVDPDQSIPIAEEYERQTGQEVHFEQESEAKRSIGLPAKIKAEAKNPRADVFWSNEIMAMIDLSIRGILDDLPEGVAEDFPEAWRDPHGRFVAFGGRWRVLMVNTELLPNEEDWPDSVEDLLDEKYHEMGLVTCMAKPLTGTTYTQAVALLTRDEPDAKRFLDAVVQASDEGRLKLVESNGQAMRLARESENKCAFCLTDTDDAWKAVQDGKPVAVVYPDQADDRPGSVLIPNTVGLVKGRPHPENALTLLRWLVSRDNELRLANGPSAQVPLRTDLATAPLPDHVKRPGTELRAMDIDWEKVGENRDRWLDYLNARFRAPRTGN